MSEMEGRAASRVGMGLGNCAEVEDWNMPARDCTRGLERHAVLWPRRAGERRDDGAEGGEEEEGEQGAEDRHQVDEQAGFVGAHFGDAAVIKDVAEKVEDEEDKSEDENDLNEMRIRAGLEVKTSYVEDEYIKNLKAIAGF